MPNPGLDDQTKRETLEAFEKYGSVTAAAEALGINRSTFDTRYRSARAEPPKGTATPQEVDEVRRSAVSAFERDLQRAVLDPDKGIAAPVVARMDGIDDMPNLPQMWADAEEDCEREIAKLDQREVFEVDLTDPENPHRPVAICAQSDQHIRRKGATDMKRLREDAEWIRRTDGLYTLLGGDGVDNHIKHRSAYLNARTTPGDEWMLYDYLWVLLGHKILGVVSGNHGHWTKQLAGVDMVQLLARHRRIAYSPHGMQLHVTLGKQKYLIHMRHQYRFSSSLNLLHTVKRMYDMGKVPFDIGIVCHHHEAEVGSFNRHGFERWGARPGSYCIGTDYSDQYGFNRTYPTCPTFILWPDERRIDGFADVRRATDTLKAVREKADA